MTTVAFATFVYSGDRHRLQLRRQVESNNYPFDQVIVVHQCCEPDGLLYDNLVITPVIEDESEIDFILQGFGIDLNRPQYESPTDKVHRWRYHVVNHLKAVLVAKTDYIAFMDSDCWMVSQPQGMSWIDLGISLIETNPNIFIVSPNDGEPERMTQTISQQMFLVRRKDFLAADFDQPGWDGNPHVPGGPMPEYWGMGEGRIGLYCKHIGKYRYVLPPEYRYWHFNRLCQDGQLETDMSKY